nr:zinc finger, CCHC-type [Tanacetum cinerariifolium]
MERCKVVVKGATFQRGEKGLLGVQGGDGGDKRLEQICSWPFHREHLNEDNVFYTPLCAYVSDCYRLTIPAEFYTQASVMHIYKKAHVVHQNISKPMLVQMTITSNGISLFSSLLESSSSLMTITSNGITSSLWGAGIAAIPGTTGTSEIACTKLDDQIDEFNKLILDLKNIDIEIEDEDHALMLLTELKKRTKGIKEETGDGLYVNRKGHLKRDCPMKKSSGFVKKGKRDQDSDSSDDEGNAYFGKALVVVRNDEIVKLVMNSGGSYHMTHMRDFLYDFKVVDGGSVRLGLRRLLISLGTLEKKGYTMKMQMDRIKVIKGCQVMMTRIRKKNCVYTLEVKVMTFGVQKHGGSKQVGLKKLGYEQVGFKQLGHKQVGFKQLGHGVETSVHRVQDEKRVWFKVELQEAQRDRESELVVFDSSYDILYFDVVIFVLWLVFVIGITRRFWQYHKDNA